MKIDVVLLPQHLTPQHIGGRTVVVFDVLRATTTMAAALAAGVKEILIFESIEAAREAAARHDGPKVLCGEVRCLPPPGFDLGNSPGGFSSAHGGTTVFMATTNGTRAILAACDAETLMIGALVNAHAVARALEAQRRNVTLLCAGTDGRLAMEDVIGAGAVIDALADAGGEPESDVAQMAKRLFDSARDDLHRALRDAQGGRNVLAVGLEQDIDFAARLNSIDVTGIVRSDPLRVIST